MCAMECGCVDLMCMVECVWIWCVWWNVCGFDGCGGACLCGFDVFSVWLCVWCVRWGMTEWIWCVQWSVTVCTWCVQCVVECDCVFDMCNVVWLMIWYVQWHVTMCIWYVVEYVCTDLMFAVECDFEVDFCGYTQNTNDQFDWQRHANSTSSVGTGPSHDHTTNNGYGEDSCHDLHVQQHWTCRECIFPAVFSCYIFCYVKATDSLQAFEQINSVVFCLLEWL